jgi:hypothetical protein
VSYPILSVHPRFVGDESGFESWIWYQEWWVN